MTHRRKTPRGPGRVCCAGFVLALSLGAGLPAGAADRTLADVERHVARAYATVPQLATGDLAAMLNSGQRPVIFDVREEAEYSVSRIADAIRVDPGTWHTGFLAEHGAKLSGKDVVFYCSVGMRSSRLAGGVREALHRAGARAVYNLAGGIFRWHNEGRPLLTGTGPTPYVHPYDGTWGKLLERRALARGEPSGP